MQQHLIVPSQAWAFVGDNETPEHHARVTDFLTCRCHCLWEQESVRLCVLYYYSAAFDCSHSSPGLLDEKESMEHHILLSAAHGDAISFGKNQLDCVFVGRNETRDLHRSMRSGRHQDMTFGSSHLTGAFGNFGNNRSYCVPYSTQPQSIVSHYSWSFVGGNVPMANPLIEQTFIPS
jgi:hypothetical protein